MYANLFKWKQFIVWTSCLNEQFFFITKIKMAFDLAQVWTACGLINGWEPSHPLHSKATWARCSDYSLGRGATSGQGWLNITPILAATFSTGCLVQLCLLLYLAPRSEEVWGSAVINPVTVHESSKVKFIYRAILKTTKFHHNALV